MSRIEQKQNHEDKVDDLSSGCRLDIGEGKETNLDRCPRPRLQQQCIKYLGPVSTIFPVRMHRAPATVSGYQEPTYGSLWLSLQVERKAYEVMVENGKFIYQQSAKPLDTREGPEDAKWIFVLSTSKILYVGQKNKGTFQHSSFLAGGATLSAGRLVAEEGILKVEG